MELVMKTFSKFPQTMAAVAVASAILVSPVAANAAPSVSPSQGSVSVQSVSVQSVAKQAVKKWTKAQKDAQKAQARKFYEPLIKKASDYLKRAESGAFGAKMQEQEKFDRKYTRAYQVKVSKIEKDFAAKYTKRHQADLKKATTEAKRASLLKAHKANAKKRMTEPRAKLSAQLKKDERKHLAPKLAAIDSKLKRIKAETQRDINGLKGDLKKNLSRIDAR
jgi:hypothetical protein